MIRPFEREDADGVVALLRRVVPAWVTTPAGLLHWLETQPERARHAGWVALEEGEPAGWAESRFRWEFGPHAASVFVGVDPGRRPPGLRARLHELAEAHVEGAARIYVETEGGDDARRFLLARGFREDRAERVSVLDPSTVDSERFMRLRKEKAREGFAVVPLAAAADRGRELHRLFEAVDRDAPHSEPLVGISYEEWRALVLDRPDLDPDASVVVLAPDGRAVALSWLVVDYEGRRAWIELTGTLREFRRRGLARLAKLATIGWAAEHGLEAMYTGNDTENRPMLALNDELGFEPGPVYQDFVKDVRRGLALARPATGSQ